MSLPLYDAHNHLRDERLVSQLDDILEHCRSVGVARMVVNGTSEKDWPAVAALARVHNLIIPSFGYHPWYVRERSNEWKQRMEAFLDEFPTAIGEIGLDRWMENYDLPDQERVFTTQFQLACQRNLPITIHCLKAWGRLHELLKELPELKRGFLLHSYGGPVEMVKPFVELGAYFSISGYFANERKARQREAFKQIPDERLLIETDAPDMWPPDTLNQFPLIDPDTGKPMNHPANLKSIYQWVADLLERPVETLARQMKENFERLFGSG